MAKLRHLLLVFCAVLPAAAPAMDERPVVLVLAGQSNMIGQGRRAQLPAQRRVLPDNVELIVEGSAAGENFGPELALGHELGRNFPERRFKLLKCAVGSTSIRVWSPDWSEKEVAVTDNIAIGPLYPRLLAFVRRHLGPDERPHAVLWFQGERDARFPEAAADYAARLDAFIAALRRDFAAPEVWFILGEVNPPYHDAPLVAQMQRETPGRVPRTKVVSAAGLSKHKDRLHYDTAGQWELGRRFAAELRPTLAPATDGNR